MTEMVSSTVLSSHSKTIANPILYNKVGYRSIIESDLGQYLILA